MPGSVSISCSVVPSWLSNREGERAALAEDQGTAAMVIVVGANAEELRQRRADLLASTKLSWERLSELADAFELDGEERNIYESIRSIDYLLNEER